MRFLTQKMTHFSWNFTTTCTFYTQSTHVNNTSTSLPVLCIWSSKYLLMCLLLYLILCFWYLRVTRLCSFNYNSVHFRINCKSAQLPLLYSYLKQWKVLYLCLLLYMLLLSWCSVLFFCGKYMIYFWCLDLLY